MVSLKASPRPPGIATRSLLTLGFLIVSATGLHAQASSYLNHGELTDALRELADRSDRVAMSPIATSLEGREVWALEISAAGDQPPDERPGILVVGNLEGDHLVGSHLVLEVARFLAGPDAAMDSLLSEHVFYLVPRLNPDGAEAMFANVQTHDARNRRPIDDDNDGRTDEDPPEDLNDDGLITVMRVPDPLGRFVTDPGDRRLMIEADPARRLPGAYTLHWEGIDSDGDGFLNEDGPGGVDLNRNFQHEYPYYEPDAGPHMVSEPEARGLMDFTLLHPNIGAILTFGHSDNLVTAPDAGGELADARTLSLHALANASNDDVFEVGVYSSNSPVGALDLRGAQPGADNDPDSGRRPEVTVNGADVEYFAEASERYREITGIERVGVNRTARGAFFQYGYFQFGVPSFSTQGWMFPESDEDDAAESDPDTPDAEAPEAELLSALDGAEIDAFVDWTPYNHPELGMVDIGGFRPGTVTNPPPEQMAALGRLHGQFVAELARMLPRVRVASTEVESHGGGLFTVTVEVENVGFFPSALRQGVVAGSVDPVTVRVGVSPEDLVTGNALTSRIAQLAGSGTRERFTWLIRGTEGQSVQVRTRSDKGGTDVVDVTLGGDQ